MRRYPPWRSMPIPLRIFVGYFAGAITTLPWTITCFTTLRPPPPPPPPPHVNNRVPGGVSEEFRPGILGAWYKPPELASSFVRERQEKSAIINLQIAHETAVFVPIPGKMYWQPDHTHQEFAWRGVRLVQDCCVVDEIIVCKVRISGLKGNSGIVNVAGKSMGLGTVTIRGTIAEIAIKEDLHKGYTQFIGTTLPNVQIKFAERNVPAFPRTYGSTDSIDKETAIDFISNFDGSTDELFFTLSIGISKVPDKTKSRLKMALDMTNQVFTKAHRKWQAYFDSIPGLRCPDRLLEKFYYWSFYVFKADTYSLANNRQSYICPSKYQNWLGLLWDEDTAHIVTGARWFNDPADLKMLEYMVLHFMQPKSPQNYGLLTMAAWELYLRTRNKKFLREVYDRTLRQQKLYTAKLNASMITQYDSYEVGWDNSIRFAWGGFNKNLRKFTRPILPVDLNSYLTREYQLLAKMAEVFQESEIAIKMNEHAQLLAKAINKYMWDEKQGFYFDIFADNHDKLFCKTCCGFFPLFAGIPSKQQAKALFLHLRSKLEFNTKYAIPTIAMDYPGRGWGWSGWVCGRNNWLIDQGVARYSPKQSAWLTYKTIDLFTQNDKPQALGYQHPEKGGSKPPLFATEIAGALDMFVKHIVGCNPEPGGQIKLTPAGLNPKWKYMQWGPFDYVGKKLEIRWDRLDGKDYFADGHEGYSVWINGKKSIAYPGLPPAEAIVNVLDAEQKIK